MDRINYANFLSLAGGPGLSEALGEAWCRDYRNTFRDADIVSVTLARFTYLFDLKHERNLAAYGLSGGHASAPRDSARMAGHPKAEGRDYHRGHMMAHSAGGGTDINLFIQKGAVNIGPFRELERLGDANPGSFYFVRLLYALGPGQRPAFVEQGIFLDTKPVKLETRYFPN